MSIQMKVRYLIMNQEAYFETFIFRKLLGYNVL
jgi:hypothetical protein